MKTLVSSETCVPIWKTKNNTNDKVFIGKYL